MIAALDKRCDTVAYFRGYGYLKMTDQYVELWGSKAGGFIENFEIEWQADPERKSDRFGSDKPVPAPTMTTPGVTRNFWRGLFYALLIIACGVLAAEMAVKLVDYLLGLQ